MPQWLKNLIGTPVKNELATIAADLTANAETYEAEAAAAGQTGVEFLENKIGTLVKNTGNPFVNGLFTLLEADFGPELNALLTGLAGQGVTTVTKLIPEVAAWLVKEEANV